MRPGKAPPGLLSRLRSDRRGVTAVEFALLAPVMVTMYFGLCEFCQGFMAQKRMGHVASTIADLVTRSNTMDAANMADVFSVGPMVMKPFASSALKQRITHLTMDSTGAVNVDWSQGQGMVPRAAGETVVIPADLIATGESVVMAEVSYDYDSPIDYMLPGLTHLSNTYYLRPRRVDQVVWKN